MVRERILKVVLVLLGLLFLAAAYPLVLFYAQEPALAMMLSLYFTLGIFFAAGRQKPGGTSQPHRVYGLFELCAWSSNVDTGVQESNPRP